jgi:hypothetical protein
MLRNNRHEVVERGQRLYQATIRSRVEPAHAGKFVVLDVETGDYEVDADKLAALNRLLARQPGAVPYIVRAGRPTAVTLGAASIEGLR